MAKFNGDNFILTNYSSINATATGVLVKDGTGDVIDNRGTITTIVGHAIDVQNDGVTIINTGTISGANTAISVTAGSRGIVINNSGTIATSTMGNKAIVTLGGDDTIANGGGAINGHIDLGGGTNGIGNTGTVTGNITTGGGDDTLTNNGVMTGAVNLGNGVNVITNGNASVTARIIGNITGGTGKDELNNKGTITGQINLGDGNNILRNGQIGAMGMPSNNGTINGNITSGAGDDDVTNYATVNGNVLLGDGLNTLQNYATGRIVGNYTGGSGTDQLFNRGTIDGSITMGGGDDIVTLFYGMSITGTINGGGDNDRLVLTGGVAGNTQTFNSSIFDIENLRKEGDGTWILDRDYSFSGGVTVSAGQLTLAANRTLTASVAIGPGSSIFSGFGTVTGNVTVNNGGRLRPGGGGTGTLTVNGNVTLNAGALVEVAVGPGSAQSKLVITGNANLNGNGIMTVAVAPGFYKGNTTYNVIETTTGNVTGVFGSVSFSRLGTRFTRFGVNYLPKAVQVSVEKLNYNIVGMTYNQRQAGDGLFRGMQGSVAGSDMEVVAGAFEGLPNDEAMQRALDSLSGVEWASMGEVRGGVSRSFRGVGMERVGVMSEGMGVWGQLLEGRNDVEGDGNGAGIKGKVQGLVGGMEYGFGEGKVGVMVGYGDGQMKLSGMGEGKVEMVMGGVYGGWSFGGIEVEGGLSYGEGKQRVERQIGVGGIQRRVEGHEKVQEFGGNVGVGYEIKLGMIEITPSVGFEVVRYEEKGFKENGGGDVGLVGGKERGWRGQGEVELKVGGVFQAGAVTFSPYVQGGYERVVMGKGYMERDVAFAGNENGTGFNVRGTDGGKDQFKAGAGINVGFGPVVLELGYEQSVGGKRDNQMFQGGLSVRW